MSACCSRIITFNGGGGGGPYNVVNVNGVYTVTDTSSGNNFVIDTNQGFELDADGDTGITLQEGATDSIDFVVDGATVMSLSATKLTLNGIFIDPPTAMQLQPMTQAAVMALPGITFSESVWLNSVDGHLYRGTSDLEALASGTGDGVVTNVSVSGSNLVFTGINGGFNGTIALPAGADGVVTNVVPSGQNLVFTGTGTGFDGVVPLPAGADGVVTNVAVSGFNLVFTGMDGGFNGVVALPVASGADGAVTNVVASGNDLVFTGVGAGFNGTVSLPAGADGVVTNVVASGQNLVFTGVSGGFDGIIALPADTNYANTDLLADGNRAHNWGAFDQTENFTTGTFIADFDNGGATGRIKGDTTSIQLNHLDGVNSNQLTIASDLFRAEVSDAFLVTNINSGQAGSIRLNDGDGSTFIEMVPPAILATSSVWTLPGDGPNVGDVLTVSGVTGNDPILVWSPLPSGGQNYATVDLTANGNHIHTWGGFSQTENFTGGSFGQTFASGGSTNTINRSNTGNSQIVTVGANSTAISQNGSIVGITYTSGVTVGFQAQQGAAGQEEVFVVTNDVANGSSVINRVLGLADPATGEAEWIPVPPAKVPVVKQAPGNVTLTSGDLNQFVVVEPSGGNGIVTLPDVSGAELDCFVDVYNNGTEDVTFSTSGGDAFIGSNVLPPGFGATIKVTDMNEWVAIGTGNALKEPYTTSFALGEWLPVSGTGFGDYQYSLPETTHQLGTGMKLVQVYDSAGEQQTVRIIVDKPSGDVSVIAPSGLTFAGDIIVDG